MSRFDETLKDIDRQWPLASPGKIRVQRADLDTTLDAIERAFGYAVAGVRRVRATIGLR